MQPDLHRQVTAKLIAEYRLVDRGEWLRQGTCPDCKDKKSLFANAAAPWVVICGREVKCGFRKHVKELFPDLFDNWSDRFKATEENPTAAADAYLQFARGLNLTRLGRCYTQESFFDSRQRIGSATVRFTLANGAIWERLIDRPDRFDRKAHFQKGSKGNGEWWVPPALTIDRLAAAKDIWIPEGIFCAASLNQRGITAAAAMSCNWYPGIALERLADHCANHNLPRPHLVFAFDGNAPGRESMVKAVHRARKAGWTASAALTTAEVEAKPADWNDLHVVDSDEKPSFSEEKIAEYRWNGDVLLAESAMEKAKLIAIRKGMRAFPLEHAVRTYWASVNEARVAELIGQMDQDSFTAKLPADEKRALAIDDAMNISEIANCTIDVLYFQFDSVRQEGDYFTRISFPVKRQEVTNLITAGQMSAAPDFSKRLAALSPSAIFEGSTHHLIQMRKRWVDRRRVEGVYVTGYISDIAKRSSGPDSKTHKAWIFPRHAISKGRVYHLNNDKYFDIDGFAVKPVSDEGDYHIEWNGEEFDPFWLPLLWQSFGERGIVTLASWLAIMFAEQIRAKQQSFYFLELWGQASSGKSTLIEWLWQLCGRGRIPYEGFDPQRNTRAYNAREMAKVGNLPIVFIESDRPDGDGKRAHSQAFDWSEIKPLYNGRGLRGRAAANGGYDTTNPPFRAGLVIAQNDQVASEEPVLSRIVSLQFSRASHTPATKAAVEKLLEIDPDRLSGFVIEAARQEERLLKIFFDRFKVHEAAVIASGKTAHNRLIKCHAQLMAAVDMLAAFVGMPVVMHESSLKYALDLAGERNTAIAANHPTVTAFWEKFEYLEGFESETLSETIVNHSIHDDIVAVNLADFEAKCSKRGLQVPPMLEVKKHLKTSRTPKFIEASKMVRSRTGNTLRCWTFHRPPAGAAGRPGPEGAAAAAAKAKRNLLDD